MLIDLSHPIEHGMTTYPGLPGPVFSAHLSREESRKRYAEGCEFHIARIEMVANTGTYVDAPFHRFADGADLASLPLERLANLPGIVIDLPAGRRSIEAGDVEENVRGCAVLIRTGWSRHWRSPQYGAAEHPFVGASAAEALVQRGAAIVGIDSVNIDDMNDPARPAHTILLRGGVPIAEHLTRLELLGDSTFRFFAVPAPFVAVGTFPVRAFAIVER